MEEQAADHLLLTTVYLSRLLRKHAKVRGMRITAFSVLNNLEHWAPRASNGTLSQKELADMEEVTQATMSTLIGKLRKEGLVYCERDENDTRTTNVGLTGKGTRYLKREGTEMRALMRSVLDELSPDERKTVAESQRILADLFLNSGKIQGKMKNTSGSEKRS